MNRNIPVRLPLFFVTVFAIVLLAMGAMAQTATPTPPKPAEPDENQNPFAVQPAPPLPAGMTGSNPNDPRSKLSAGLFNAGEASLGMRHLMLIKKTRRLSARYRP